jgi:hypothetical protein
MVTRSGPIDNDSGSSDYTAVDVGYGTGDASSRRLGHNDLLASRKARRETNDKDKQA